MVSTPSTVGNFYLSPCMYIYFLLICCAVWLVAQSYPTPCHPTDWSPLVPSVHGDSPGKNTGVGCHALLQGIFPTQGSNPCLLHCRQILFFFFFRDTSFYCFHHTCKLTTVYTVSEQRNNCIITRVPNYQVRQPVTDYFGEVIFTEHRNNFQIILYFQVQSYIMRPGHADNCNSHTKSPS